MPTKLELLEEANNRGLLSGRNLEIYNEAKNRGLVGGLKQEYSAPPTEAPPTGFISTMTSEREMPEPGESAKIVSTIARPMLEGGGLVGGGFIGTAAQPISGTVVGAGLGYAAGSNMADRLDEFLGIKEVQGLMKSTKKAGADILEGGKYEIAGSAIGAGVAATGKSVISLAKKAKLDVFFKKIKDIFPTLSDRGMLLKAKEILKELKDESELAQKNIKETDRVFDRFGIKEKPTYAQKTGSSKAAGFEQSASSKNAELRDILLMKDAKIKEEALKGLEKEFIGIPGEIDDAISGVTKVKEGLKGSVDKAAGKVADDVTDLASGKGVQETGTIIQTELKSLKTAAKKEVNKLYDKIPPDTRLRGDTIRETYTGMVKDYVKRGGGKDSFPVDISRQIKTALKKSKDGTLSFDFLRDIRSQISEGMHEALMGSKPNLKVHRRLQMLQKGVDESLDQMLKLSGEQSQTANLYRDATNAYKEYANRFKTGEVGKVLERGNQASGYKVAYSDVPARFFRNGKMDASDDLIRAMGKGDASKAVEEYAALDLLSKGDLTSKSVTKWLANNREVLAKYGLWDKFKGVLKNQESLDFAASKLDDFNKTVASNIIGVDVGQVVRSVFSGRGGTRSVQTATELLNLPGIKDNPAAVNGIRKAFKDFFVEEIKVSGVDRIGNPLQAVNPARKFLNKYGPAMRVVFKGKEGQLSALSDYHKLLGFLQRNKNVSYAGNSTTAEKLTGTEVGKSIFRNTVQFLAVAQGSGWYMSSLRNLASAIFGAPGRMAQKKIDDLLIEAIVNPEVAETIMMATKKFVPKKELYRRIKHHMVTLGLYSSKEDENE